jgi:hypothetical protein
MKATILMMIVSAAAISAPPAAVAQRVPQTGDPLMDYRLRASRAERDRVQVSHDADELVELSRGLAGRCGETGSLASNDDAKAIGRIRKLAKHIRTSMGCYGDTRMADPPKTVHAAAVALAERSGALHEELCAATRYEVSARAVALVGEIIVLTDYLDGARKQTRE